MARRARTAALGLALLVVAVGRSPAGGEPEPGFGKPDLALVVNLKVPADEKMARIMDLFDKPGSARLAEQRQEV